MRPVARLLMSCLCVAGREPQGMRNILLLLGGKHGEQKQNGFRIFSELTEPRTPFL